MHLFIKEKEIEKIVLEHLLRIRKIEEEVCVLIRQQIDQMTARILLMINQNLKNKDYSKKYECLYRLMEVSRDQYEQFIQRVEREAHIIDDETVRDIFVGIQEIAINTAADIEETDDNPIAYERMVMISAGILKIKQYLQNDMADEYGQCNIGNHVDKAELIEYMNRHVTEFFENALPKIHEIIDDTITSLSIREAAKPYMDRMMDQKHKLETLVLVQIDVIEDRLHSAESEEVVRALTAILQEIYQQTLTVEQRIRSVQNEQISSEEIITMEEIQVIIEDHLLSRSPKVTGLLQSVEDNRQDSLTELLDKVTDELDNLTGQTVSEIKESSAPYQILSCQILELFSKAALQLRDMAVECQTEEGARITAGILETMDLKAEVLKEKDMEYQISKKDVSIVEEKKLYDIKAEFESQAESILNEAIDGSNEGFLGVQGKFKRRVDAIKSSHMKHDMTYLRNDLLFELRTFDELVRHSVEKLAEYEKDNAEPVIAVMKHVYTQSRKALNRNGILFLEPEPHEKFNGKLHEIMIAEEAEGFTKGEVIKCQNIGYIKDDYVIMRANVVAAK